MKEYTVKELASLVDKHEETIKRWIRAGKFPNAYCKSDKEGWRIPEGDLISLNGDIPHKKNKNEEWVVDEQHELELIKLAYEAVTLTSPTDEILYVFSIVGIKRTLEILLIMQQSATKVKNPDGFIKKAVRENWSPTTVPVKLPKIQSKKIYDLSEQDINNVPHYNNQPHKPKVPIYNWLEE